MIRNPVAALAVLLLLLADRSFAGACETGIATGADPPDVTRLRSYAWTFHAPARLALAGNELTRTRVPSSGARARAPAKERGKY